MERQLAVGLGSLRLLAKLFHKSKERIVRDFYLPTPTPGPRLVMEMLLPKTAPLNWPRADIQVGGTNGPADCEKMDVHS